MEFGEGGWDRGQGFGRRCGLEGEADEDIYVGVCVCVYLEGLGVLVLLHPL